MVGLMSTMRKPVDIQDWEKCAGVVDTEIFCNCHKNYDKYLLIK